MLEHSPGHKLTTAAQSSGLEGDPLGICGWFVVSKTEDSIAGDSANSQFYSSAQDDPTVCGPYSASGPDSETAAMAKLPTEMVIPLPALIRMLKGIIIKNPPESREEDCCYRNS